MRVVSASVSESPSHTSCASNLNQRRSACPQDVGLEKLVLVVLLASFFLSTSIITQRYMADLGKRKVVAFFDNNPASSLRPIYHADLPNCSSAPLVSVVVPFTCNKIHLFAQTFLSIQRQTLRQYEALVISDGCVDSAVLDQLLRLLRDDCRFRLDVLQPNKGVSYARNHGFRNARAPYVFQIDSDDLAEPTALEVFFWYLETHPVAQFVGGWHIGFGAEQYHWKKGFENVTVFPFENVCHCAAMMRRSGHQLVGGYNEKRKGLEDWELWLTFAEQGLWGGAVPLFLTWYRRRANHLVDWPDWSAMDTVREEFVAKFPKLYSGHFPPVANLSELSDAEERQLQALLASLANGKRWQTTLNIVPRLPDRQRILMFIPWMITGGADFFHLRVVRDLVARDWDVTVVATFPTKPDFEQTLMPEFLQFTPDLFILSSFLPSQAFLAFCSYLLRSRQFDVVLISNSGFAYEHLSQLRAATKGMSTVPLFVDFVHGTFTGEGYAEMSVASQDLLDGTITISHKNRNWMIRHGRAAHAIDVCTIGVDTTEFAPNPRLRQMVRNSLGIEDSDQVLLYACRIEPEKQPLVFAETMRLLALDRSSEDFDSVFHVLVAGDGSLLPELRRLLTLLERPGFHVHIFGDLTNVGVRNLMAASDIFFLPSQFEGIALVLYEAMAAGLVFVGADVGAHSEVITPSCDCGVLEPRALPNDEASAYAQIIHSLLMDPERRARMSAAAVQRVQSFSSASLPKCLLAAFARSTRRLQIQYEDLVRRVDSSFAHPDAEAPYADPGDLLLVVSHRDFVLGCHSFHDYLSPHFHTLFVFPDDMVQQTGLEELVAEATRETTRGAHLLVTQPTGGELIARRQALKLIDEMGWGQHIQFLASVNCDIRPLPADHAAFQSIEQSLLRMSRDFHNLKVGIRNLINLEPNHPASNLPVLAMNTIIWNSMENMDELKGDFHGHDIFGLYSKGLPDPRQAGHTSFVDVTVFDIGSAEENARGSPDGFTEAHAIMFDVGLLRKVYDVYLEPGGALPKVNTAETGFLAGLARGHNLTILRNNHVHFMHDVGFDRNALMARDSQLVDWLRRKSFELLGQFENPAQYMKTWQDYLRAGVEGGTFWGTGALRYYNKFGQAWPTDFLGGSVNHNLDVIVPYLQMFGYDLVASTKDVVSFEMKCAFPNSVLLAVRSRSDWVDGWSELMQLQTAGGKLLRLLSCDTCETQDMRYDRNILSIPKSARILKVENQGLCRVKGRDAGWGVYSPAYHAFLRNSERIACQDADQAQPQFVERERDEL